MLETEAPSKNRGRLEVEPAKDILRDPVSGLELL
jgi:hypothetical protein